MNTTKTLTETLTEKELAAMTNDLEVPLITQDITSGAVAFSEDMNYTLHHMLSDMGPDDALMAIALSVPKIVGPHKALSPLFQVLCLECEHIVGEYGPLLAARDQNVQGELDEGELIGILGHVPEDLEALAEMLETAYHTLLKMDATGAALLDIMSVQARSQQLIAEEYVGILNAALINTLTQETGPKGGTQAHKEIYVDNIVQFPGAQARQP